MRTQALLGLGLLAVLAAPSSAAQELQFRVTFDDSVQASAYTGRVYVALSGDTRREPRWGMGSWFNPPPLYSLDVVDLAPGGSVVLDGEALFHPVPMDELTAGTWHAQAVARRNLDNPRPGEGAGDLYGDAVAFTLGEGEPGTVELGLTRVVDQRAFPETERVRLFELESVLLSEFHGRPVTMRAGVVLPDDWSAETQRRWPIVYNVPGFGGTHFGAANAARYLPRLEPEDPRRHSLLVVLDPSCFRGHHVFADSANNGPWGTALVEELIPALEQAFHGPGESRHRYVTGVSSGGWSSLWLQVTYPEHFGSCYSHVPDPVDLRDFQCIDLYREGENMYRDGEGERRPVARSRGEVSLWYEDFVGRETVLGPGGQIHSFEAVFSPRGEDGAPRPLFDRESGAVDTEVARTWEAYDIRMGLERRWEEVGPKLAGKLHVYAGEVDTFYLEGAVRLLRESLQGLESDAVCEIVPEMAHSLHRPGDDEMYRALLAGWSEAGGGE